MQKTKYTYESFCKLSLEERKKLYLQQKSRRPNSIPTILSKYGKSLLPELNQCRVLLPQNHPVINFKKEVQALLNKKRSMQKQTLILVSNNKVMQGMITVKDVYDKAQNNSPNSDGWFYVVYSNSEAF